MELQGGSRVESGITGRVKGLRVELQRGSRVGAELQGGSREESGITWRVEGREWNYREGQG